MCQDGKSRGIRLTAVSDLARHCVHSAASVRSQLPCKVLSTVQSLHHLRRLMISTSFEKKMYPPWDSGHGEPVVCADVSATLSRHAAHTVSTPALTAFSTQGALVTVCSNATVNDISANDHQRVDRYNTQPNLCRSYHFFFRRSSMIEYLRQEDI